MPSLAELYKHFKNLSMEDDVNNAEPENIDLENAFQQMDDYVLNQDFESYEIIRVVKGLKTSKAGGLDGILNEYIKST